MDRSIHWSQIRVVLCFEKTEQGNVLPIAVNAVALNTPEGEQPLSLPEVNEVLRNHNAQPLVVGDLTTEYVVEQLGHDLPKAPVPRHMELSKRLRVLIDKLIPLVGLDALGSMLEGIAADLFRRKHSDGTKKAQKTS